MLRPRIIACLLVRDNGLVKTVKFKDDKYVGDPINAVKIFNEKEADELMVLDIDATLRRREPNYRLISQFAAESRMPLCYGGGVASVSQATQIIGLGVEKVALSTAAINKPRLVAEIAQEVGSQSVVVVLDVRRHARGGWDVHLGSGRVSTGRDVIDASLEAEANGAGEIVINSVDCDGVMQGYDIELACEVRNRVQVPLTILGGAGSHADIVELLKACGVVGAAAGSLFVFKGVYRAVLINYPTATQKAEILRMSGFLR